MVRGELHWCDLMQLGGILGADTRELNAGFQVAPASDVMSSGLLILEVADIVEAQAFCAHRSVRWGRFDPSWSAMVHCV